MSKGNEPEYLVRGAQLQCRCGSAPRKLNLPLCHGVYVTNQPMMNADDNKANVNVMFFGICEKTGEKCDPQICSPWLKPQMKTMVSGSPAITMDSFLVCSKGGLIEPKTSGQEMTEAQSIAEVVMVAGIAATAGTLAAMAVGAAMAAKNKNKEKTESNEDRTNKGLGKMTMSQKGFDLLKHHENNPSVLQGWGLGVYNGSTLTGIYPHYVFRISKATGKWESDGGMTFGFGHYVSQSEYGTDATEKALVDKYAKGTALIPSNIPLNGVSYIVPGSTYMPIKDVETLLKNDIAEHEQELEDTINKYGFSITQEQFDALVNLRYHKYRLGKDIDDLLKAKDHDKLNWETAIKSLIGVNGDINRANDLIDLFNNGTYPAGI